jgi:hypothetical protein
MATLTDIPARLTAGDSASWTVEDSQYPATAGWSMRYALVSASAQLQLNSTASGDAHAFALSTTTSATLSAGRWAWQRYALRTGERVTLGTGAMEVLPDLAAATAGLDTRSSSRAMLENIEAWMRAPDSCAWVAEIEIAGRKIKNHTVPDLLALIEKLKRDVRGEDAAEALANGRSPRNRILVRFGR